MSEAPDVSILEPWRSADCTAGCGAERATRHHPDVRNMLGAGAAVVRVLGGIPIDYRSVDFVKEIRRFTGDGVDVVFDGIACA